MTKYRKHRESLKFMNYTLIERAQNPRKFGSITKEESDELWEQANQAMHYANLSECYAAVEALLCQAAAGHVLVAELLCLPIKTKLGEVFGEERLRGLTDRVEALNNYIDL